ncbi:MAG: undecaprenyl-diphosphate phosphatase [Ruminococcus bromii]|nr:undecaprenyl-diphosphate phosphatase [Ruminococcus bromii]
MSIWEAIIQGIVQGATEFLPVSSSGHLSLSQHILGVQIDSLLFDILLHLGTLIAVVAVYYKLILRLLKAFGSLVVDLVHGEFRWKEMDHDRRLLMMLVIGLIPLFLLFLPVPGTGMKLKDISELWAADGTIWIEGLAFLMTSALLFLGIRATKKMKVHKRTGRDGKVVEIKGRTKFHTVDAVCVGITQCAAAVFPGLSRSGSTLSAGLLRGINQQTALDYSFVLGIPSILAAAMLTIKDAVGQPVDIGVGAMIAGVVTAAVVGFLAIKLLKWIVTTNKLQIFAYYTLILGAVTLIIAVIEAISGTNLFTGAPLR